MSLTTTTARERRYGIASQDLHYLRDLHIRRDLEERGIHRPRPREMETVRCLAALDAPWEWSPSDLMKYPYLREEEVPRRRARVARLHSLPEVPLP